MKQLRAAWIWSGDQPFRHEGYTHWHQTAHLLSYRYFKHTSLELGQCKSNRTPTSWTATTGFRLSLLLSRSFGLSVSCSQSFSIPISQLPFLGVYPFLSTYRGLELWRSEIILSAGNTNSHFAICAAKNESFFARNRLKAFLLLLLLAPRLSPADIIPMDIFRTNGLLKFISEVVTLTVF